MPPLSADRDTVRRDGIAFEYPVKTNVKIYAGAIVVIDAAAYATKGAVATTLKAVGVAQDLADNTGGVDGAIKVKVRRGCFRLANSTAGDLITLTEVGSDCYIVDDFTVAKTNGTNTRSVAGKVRDVDAAGVWVEF